MKEKDFKNIDPQDVKIEDLDNIDAYLCVLGLAFPESATEFQKAFLVLAHLMACCRDFVLKGHDIPEAMIIMISKLANIIMWSHNAQR